jgi:hypothetical protein
MDERDQRFLDPGRLSEVQPALVAFGAMIFGFILLAASFMLGVGQVTVGVKDAHGAILAKEVGYGAAPNWSIVSCLLLPAAILYLCKAYRSFPLVLRDLSIHKMAVGAELTPLAPAELEQLWRQDLRRFTRPLVVFMGIGFVVSIWEWATNSLVPLAARDAGKAPELDWSLGVLFDSLGRPVHAGLWALIGNGAFSFVAFLVQGVIIAALLTFLYMALIVGTFVTDLSRPEGAHRLVPDPGSPDDRLGFESFGSFIETSLIFVGIVYMIFYLSRVQNIYLRASDASILDFAAQRLLLGIIKNPLDLGAKVEVFTGALDHTGSLDYSSLMVALGTFAVLAVAIFMIFSTVRDAAVRARDELSRCLAENPQPTLRLLRMTKERAEARLDRMVFWPVRYIRAREFFAIAIMGAICIVFYKLAMILFGLLVFRIFWGIAKYILGLPESRGRKADAGAGEPAVPEGGGG